MIMRSPPASGWPWMKNEEFAIADPIAPTSDEDDRPAVKELMEEYREHIDKLRDGVKDHELYAPAKHDDLWLLRFLLSHKKKHSSALKAAQQTLEFRAKNNLDAHDVRNIHVGHTKEHESHLMRPAQLFLDCCDPDTFRMVVHDRCVVCYVQWAGLDHPKLLQNVSPEDWKYGMVIVTEWTHQWLDYQTRTTGRLTKAIRVIDLADVGLKKNGNPKAAHRDAKALNAMEDFYPQLLHAMYLTHAPFWVEGPWKVIKPLVPKRVLTKFDFLEPAKKEKDLKKLTKFIDVHKLPTRLGGKVPSWPDETPPPL